MLHIKEEEAVIKSVKPMEWSDSCLGLGHIDESCLQAITPGYEILVSGAGREIIYRTNDNGDVIRRES